MTTVAAISIGNSFFRAGRLESSVLDETVVAPIAEPETVVKAVEGWLAEVDRGDRAVVLASVNRPVADALRPILAERIGGDLVEMEKNLAAPIGRGLDPESLVGVDRLLAAAAAWEELKQACIVVDAGTAVTVDFVDGEGVFQGGAILPGVNAMLKTMATANDLLPDLEFEHPEGEPWGRNTVDAMQRGVHGAVAGGVWKLVERYALAYGGFPLVIATGGDATKLFPDDELVSRVVPDLVLRGMALAWKTATEDAES